MDRFIGFIIDLPDNFNEYLKSNMDRFIASPQNLHKLKN